MIIEELKSIQRQHGYLPAEQLVKLSKKIETPLSQIHGVASFYPHFRLSPPARAEVRVCADMACHLRGSRALRTSLEQSFAGTSEKDLSISAVSCLGRCDVAREAFLPCSDGSQHGLLFLRRRCLLLRDRDRGTHGYQEDSGKYKGKNNCGMPSCCKAA